MKSSSKGVKADGNITISGGEIYVTTTGNGAEGMNSGSSYTLSNGSSSTTATAK